MALREKVWISRTKSSCVARRPSFAQNLVCTSRLCGSLASFAVKGFQKILTAKFARRHKGREEEYAPMQTESLLEKNSNHRGHRVTQRLTD